MITTEQQLPPSDEAPPILREFLGKQINYREMQRELDRLEARCQELKRTVAASLRDAFPR